VITAADAVRVGVLGPLEVTDAAGRPAARLAELRDAALLDRIDADLALGAAGPVLIGELRELTAADPLAERCTALLMRALAASGRQAEALAVYQRTRGLLADSLGVDPSPQLHQAYLAVLRQEVPPGTAPSAAAPSAAAPSAAALILDNCEHLIDAAAALAARLLADCPGVRVLATSREPIGIGGETLYQVGPLAAPPAALRTAGQDGLACPYPAVRLFADRAAAVLPGFALTPGNEADVGRICRALDGLPLAIELAAPWLRTLAPAQLAERLAEQVAERATRIPGARGVLGQRDRAHRAGRVHRAPGRPCLLDRRARGGGVDRPRAERLGRPDLRRGQTRARAGANR
jgi:Bacterial transcriptional activator domain